MKARSIGLTAITVDDAEGIKLHQTLVEVAKNLSHPKFSYFSVFSNEMEDDVEIVAEGPEDASAVYQVLETLQNLGYSLTDANTIIDAIHGAGVIFREVEL